mgnify:CR=1 FL=1
MAFLADKARTVSSTQTHTSKMNFEKVKELMLQNVSKTKSKTFVQYTKERLKTYIKNPYSNIDNIRNVSAFLARTSMIYKKILAYFAQMPLFYYNLVYRSDFSKEINYNKFIKSYQDVAQKLQEINMQKEFSSVISTALRDGVYYGFVYDGEGDGFFLHALDPAYCKISAISGNGTYVISFKATYFDSGNNKEYLYGINDDGEGTWDKVFIEGYENYKNNGNDYMWFDLPVEKTICLLADEDAEMPLPYFLPVFVSLLDLLDLEQILASKTELENYVLLLSKIPLLTNTDDIDDFAVSLELVQMIQNMIDEVVPDLVGTAYSPCDLEVINFNKSNSSEDTDKLATSMSNLFSNLGISELVVSSGKSSNSVGLRHSIKNDESFALKFVDRLENWMDSYIRMNYSEEFIFKFHRITYFSQEEYVGQMKDSATLGLPVATDWATALGQTPYEMMCSTFMENALGIKNGLWRPLQSSYTQTTDGSDGKPELPEDQLTDEGLDTRDAEKNITTKEGK